MSETERLSNEFAAEYPDKIFYFCLRGCGDPHDAEDLSSDIALCVLSQLSKGIVPNNFSAWVCQYDIIRTNGKILIFQGVSAFVGAHSIPFPALKDSTNYDEKGGW